MMPHELFLIPINIMLKDNADDIAEKIGHLETNPVLQKIRNEFEVITKTMVPQLPFPEK